MTHADWIRRIGSFMAEATTPQLADLLVKLDLPPVWCDGKGLCRSREAGMPEEGDCKVCIERYLLTEHEQQ